MSEFNAKKLNPDNINGGKKFNNRDGFSANDLNGIVEGVLYNETQGGGSGAEVSVLTQEQVDLLF